MDYCSMMDVKDSRLRRREFLNNYYAQTINSEEDAQCRAILAHSGIPSPTVEQLERTRLELRSAEAVKVYEAKVVVARERRDKSIERITANTNKEIGELNRLVDKGEIPPEHGLEARILANQENHRTLIESFFKKCCDQYHKSCRKAIKAARDHHDLKIECHRFII